MNSVFDKFRPQRNNMFDVIKEYRKIQQNPSQIGDMLFKSRKINKEQYEHIKNMNSPREIGEYLLNSNKDFQKMYNGTR